MNKKSTHGLRVKYDDSKYSEMKWFIIQRKRIVNKLLKKSQNRHKSIECNAKKADLFNLARFLVDTIGMQI